MKKFLGVFLAGVLSVFSFAACGKYGGGMKDNSGKTTLYVGNYDAGIGHEWLSAVAADFEREYATTVFQEGKTGVHVEIDNDKDSMINIATLPTLRDHLFITEGVRYYDLMSTNRNGQRFLADITDIVTAPLNDGTNKTIEQKMAPELNSYYKTAEGKYYALPLSEGYYGFYYNMSVLDNENLWLGATAGTYVGADGAKSKGPDGISGTDDDGLPATFDEFFAWINKMVNKSVKPMCWYGSVNGAYPERMLNALWTDIEGKDEYYLNYSFKGTAHSLVKSAENGNVVTEELLITNENGYELQRQAGKYYALEFAKRIMDGGTSYYSTTSASQTQLQQEYISSEAFGSPIALIIEGSWWQNETKATFDELASEMEDESLSFKNSRYGYLPFPKVDDARVGEDRTLLSYNDTSVFVNAYTATGDMLDVAKLFVQFMHKEAQLQTFTAYTGMPKPFTYSMSGENMAKMNTLGQQLYTLHNKAWQSDSKVKIVYPFSTNLMWLNNSSVFWGDDWAFQNSSYKLPFQAFASNSMSVWEYFTGMKSYQQTKWANLRNK